MWWFILSSPLYRCMLLTKSFTTVTHNVQMWKKKKQDRSRVDALLLSPAVPNLFLALLAVIQRSFYFKVLPFFLLRCFQPPSPPSPFSPLPFFVTSRQRMGDELMQYTASPKGTWEFYSKDLIDWCLRQDLRLP